MNSQGIIGNVLVMTRYSASLSQNSLLHRTTKSMNGENKNNFNKQMHLK